MREKLTLEGRSLIFNIVFVVLNLVGLTFLVLAYHESTGVNAVLFKMIGWIAMMLSIGGLIIFKGRLMMSSVARVLVGGLFIVSGLVKANDPLGFSYKLEEYFEDGALAYRIKELFGAPWFSLEFLIDSALFFSVVICIAEIVLGVLVIIGGKMKLVSYLMMIMLIFFTFLTWHTSNCNPHTTFVDHDTYVMNDPGDAALVKTKLDQAAEQNAQEKQAKKDKKEFKKSIWVVSQSKSEVVIAEMKTTQCVDDCGCFGDALKGSVGRSLTPHESYWKDIVLLYLVVWIFLAQWITKRNTRMQNIVMVPASMLVVIFFSWVFGWYFPIFFAGSALIGALWILRAGKRIFGNHYGSAAVVLLLSLILVMYVLMYAPIKDYRPYHVGSNLIEKMNDGTDGQYLKVFLYKNVKTGKQRELTEAEYMTSNIWEDSNWVFIDRIQKTIVESKPASILDFNPSINVEDLSDDERNNILVQKFIEKSILQTVRYKFLSNDSLAEIALEDFNLSDFPETEYQIIDTTSALDAALKYIEIKDQILAQKKVAIVISRDLTGADWSSLSRLKEIQKECAKSNVPFIIICNATRKEINAFKKKNNFNVAIFSLDDIELKIISRSNPALLILDNAVVKAKYAHRSIPNGKTFKNKHLK